MVSSIANGLLAGQVAAQIATLNAAIAAAQGAVSANLQLTSMTAATNSGPLGLTYDFSVSESAMILNAIIAAMQNEVSTLTAQLSAIS